MINRERARSLRGRVRRWFPERQIHIRTGGSVKFFRISTAFQAASTCFLIGFMGWVTFTSWTYTNHAQIISQKNNDISNANLSYHSLLGEVAQYQTKFSSITEELEENHSMMLGLVEKNSSLRQSLNSVSKQLAVTNNERLEIEKARRGLRGELLDIENQLRATALKNFSLKDNLSSVENNLQTVLEERNLALFEGSKARRELERLESRRQKEIAALEARMENLQNDQASAVERLTRQTLDTIVKNEKIIELTGLDTETLIGLNDPSADGQGGPFISATAGDEPGGKIRADLDNLDAYLNRLNSLQTLMSRIPLIAPLDTYTITSSFGKRRDPKNRKWAAHYGLDMVSHKNAKVYAPAAGTVTFAGWKGNFGRLVEIDHGAGFKTRYGHLKKIYVKRGKKVNFRDEIGVVGNSGRSTGTHLHYEIAFNGKTKNPSKFIKAGRHVFQK